MQVANWQIATDILFAIIKAQRQNFPHRFKDLINRNICGILKLKIMNKCLFYNHLLVQIIFALYRNE